MLALHGGRRTVFVLHDGIAGKLRRLTTSLVDGAFPIEWIMMGDRLDSSLYVPPNHLSRAAYGRLFLPDLLPADVTRCVYVDCDVLIRRDLDELCRADLHGNPAGLCVDPFHRTVGRAIPRWRQYGLDPADPYFNSGVMAMDLDAWRAGDVTAESRRIAQAASPEELGSADQDVLNIVLYRKWTRLAAKWNVHPIFVRRLGKVGVAPEVRELMRQPDVAEARHDPAIVHFVGQLKPWLPQYRGGLHSSWYHEWARFAAMTPFKKQLLGGWTTRARHGAWSLAARPLDLAIGRRHKGHHAAENLARLSAGRA
jgi:lipopolysaccharide biosynthesis glycosyltransferase